MKQDACGCCEGSEQQTPLDTANRPGLDALSYRVGTHATFLETMKARLASMCVNDGGPCDDVNGLYPLQRLTTRDSSDPAIAWLDAWATVGDVLTFYQERIANEGYLRTATERRSILELARLVGYRLRPGVAASVYLAFLLEDRFEGETEIPAGTRAQSIPGPGEVPQSFETAEPLLARTTWNRIRPRLKKPQRLIRAAVPLAPAPIYFRGVNLNLAVNDPILIDFGDGQEQPELYRVASVSTDAAADLTIVTLREWRPEALVTAISVASSPGTAAIGTSLPAALRATPLRNFATALSTIGDAPEPDIEALVWQFADALLATFTVLAQMFPSTSRDQAIAQDVAVLLQIEKLLSSMIGNVPPQATVEEPLQRMYTWTKQSLAVLQGAPTGDGSTISLDGLVTALSQSIPDAALPPASALRRPHDASVSYGLQSDFRLAAIARLLPHSLTKEALYQGLETATVTPEATVKVYVLRTEAAPFGHNAPLRPDEVINQIVVSREWEINDPWNETPGGNNNSIDSGSSGSAAPNNSSQAAGELFHLPDTLYLDAEYEMKPNSWVVIESPGITDPTKRITLQFQGDDQVNLSLAAYGLNGKTTVLNLPDGKTWFANDGTAQFDIVRSTRVYLQSEELTLAQAPISNDVPDTSAAKGEIIVDGLYDGLEPGRWLIVSGERTDIRGVSGIRASGLVMLQSMEQFFEAGLAGDTYHTRLIFANELAHTYKRDTVTIYANVVKATHGETQKEVLGSGRGDQVWQQFTLKKPPLTYLAAPTAAGAASTLQVRVNDVLWHEADNHFMLGPTDRAYVISTDNKDNTSVIFGNGEHGARLPTGAENVTAVYRSGIGRPGNVAARQIKLLATRPLGVKEVINPLPASGGADRESRDQARRNTQLALLALDRLVSVQDYADFARTFAGIGKASATTLSDGRQQIVHLTIAGANDIPIATSSDLYINLRQALQRAGDPHQPFEIQVRELILLVIVARLRIHPDYLWEKVATQVRSVLLDTFSFDRRELGQDVLLSEVISAIQGVPGVTYVDVDTFNFISETEAIDPTPLEETNGQTPLQRKLAQLASGTLPKPRIPVKLARLADDGSRLRAQLAFLSADVPDTLVLQEIKG